MEKSTNTLTGILKKTKPDQLEEFFEKNGEEVLEQEHAFSIYMRSCVRKNGLRFQDVFLHADISEGYGYKLISGEKHTRQRDTILKLCFGAHLSLEEMQRALKIYGMAPLYPRFPRDAVLISAVSAGKYELADINRILEQNHQPVLKGTEREA